LSIIFNKTASQTIKPFIPRLYIVIPVFNESANVDQLCNGLINIKGLLDKEFKAQFIVVDDGSSDDTISRFQNNGLGDSLIILRHDTNHGPGAAFRTAFSYMAPLIKDEDWVLTMEGDNTSQLEIFGKMLAQRTNGAEVILASPNARGGEILHVVWYRLFLSYTANFMARCLLGLWGIHTLSSFYRLHSGLIIKKLQLKYSSPIVESSGFEWAVEMLAKLVRVNARIVEVPMRLDFSARKGKTKMRIRRTIQGYFRVFIQFKRRII
jgi:glycosyltransferase involved in cell wall biosynthesis